jgi:hypothetical protein
MEDFPKAASGHMKVIPKAEMFHKCFNKASGGFRKPVLLLIWAVAVFRNSLMTHKQLSGKSAEINKILHRGGSKSILKYLGNYVVKNLKTISSPSRGTESRMRSIISGESVPLNCQILTSKYNCTTEQE